VGRTKILATVGPATSAPGQLAALLNAGADALRLNLSHGSDAEHRESLLQIHQAAKQTGREVAVVADVPGPKIRIGMLAMDEVRLVTGQAWTLDGDRRAGDASRVGLELPSLKNVAKVGDPILLGDGSVELSVTAVHGSSLTTRVTNGGPVRSQAGAFLPHARIRTAAFDASDRRLAAVALEGGIDYLALSFVQDAADLVAARRWLDRRPEGRDVGLIAKIERAEALRSIEGILADCDGIMVARGDLGIEVPLERLALEQKRLVRLANAHGRFVIVATQMLLSMMDSPRPTRAEATDVANAVLDGTDAVMLSEESAVGHYPVEAVQWLGRIAAATDSSFDARPVREAIRAVAARAPPAADRSVAEAAVTLAEGVGARAIVTPTHSGRTARLVAGLRPSCPVLALSRLSRTRRTLALVRGVEARPSPTYGRLPDLRQQAAEIVRTSRIPGEGPVVLTAGFPVEGRPTNLVTLVELDDASAPAPEH
jgi:pyruvate kinase